MRDTYDVIVIGSGLSGLSAAVELRKERKTVLVLEGRSVFGGRTSSWVEEGMAIESGLHRFLGFFEHVPHLLKTVGIDPDEMLYWEDEIEIKLPDNEPSAVFGLAPLFKPAKTALTALSNNDFISPLEKAKIAAFFVKGFADLKTKPEELDTYTVASYATKQGVSKETIHRVVTPLTEGLFFLKPDKYGAYNFFALFDPYLTKLHKTRVGAFKGGMSDVMIEPIVTYLRKHGADVHANAPVTDLITDGDQVTGVVVNKKPIHAERVVIATSLAASQKLIGHTFPKHDAFRQLRSLRSMPSVTYQIELTEPSMEIDRTTFSPGTIFSSYAEQSRTTFQKSKGRLSIILESPEKYLRMSAAKILPVILSDAKRIGLRVSQQQVKSYRKVNWEQDFITYEKGSDALRPKQQTAIPGLYLAGDYTKQQYLSTMEGSVYSGILAANHVLSSL